MGGAFGQDRNCEGEGVRVVGRAASSDVSIHVHIHLATQSVQSRYPHSTRLEGGGCEFKLYG